MGNLLSKKVDHIEFLLKVDTVAAKYITSSNFSKKEKMSNLNYCDNLVIITSKKFEKSFTQLEIDYLNQRTSYGKEINDMQRDNITYAEKKDFNNLDEPVDFKKRRLCIGISKFYVRIAQLYAAIKKIVNPIYQKDIEGNTNINTNINHCQRRLNSLLNGEMYSEDKKNNNIPVNIKPDMCSFNLKKSSNGTYIPRSILDDEGIVEFETLFYDVYNYDIGKFQDMKPETKIKYKNALQRFYTAYTGEQQLPEDIKKFSDIKIRAYHDNPECKEGDWKNTYTGTLNEPLFEKYALHLKEMYKKIEEQQKKIVDQLKRVFEIKKDKNELEFITIHRKLNYDLLETIIKETQELIQNLYVTCEEEFQKGFNIFVEIIVSKNKERTENEEKSRKEKYFTTPEPIKPEAPEVVKPEAPEVVKPEAPELVKPEVPEVVKQEAPEVVKPEAPEVVKPEAPVEVPKPVEYNNDINKKKVLSYDLDETKQYDNYDKERLIKELEDEKRRRFA